MVYFYGRCDLNPYSFIVSDRKFKRGEAWEIKHELNTPGKGKPEYNSKYKGVEFKFALVQLVKQPGNEVYKITFEMGDTFDEGEIGNIPIDWKPYIQRNSGLAKKLKEFHRSLYWW